jgi:hypothetical protein
VPDSEDAGFEGRFSGFTLLQPNKAAARNTTARRKHSVLLPFLMITKTPESSFPKYQCSQVSSNKLVALLVHLNNGAP